MDFSWTEAQLSFKKDVIAFAQQHLNEDIIDRDKSGTLSRENWQKCAEFGIQGMAVPKAYGGNEQDIMTAMLAMEGFGYGCRDNGLTLALNAQMWTLQFAIQQFGSDAQRTNYLPNFCNGRWIGAQAITEPDVGSDSYSLTSSAEKVDGGYRLNGQKTMITAGPIADVVMVLATIDPSLGKWGVTAFLVDKNTPGFIQSPVTEKMGLRTVPFGDLTFQDCFIAEEQRLGKEGAGLAIFSSSLEWERSCMLASQLGAMERQLEECISYTRKRKQFGQAIGKFQSVSNRIAEMKIRLETARLLLYKTAWLKKNGKPAVMEAAMVKHYLAECYVASSMDAIRIHGGKGYTTSLEVERELRDAIGGTLYGGTSDIQRNIIAQLLGL